MRILFLFAVASLLLAITADLGVKSSHAEAAAGAARLEERHAGEANHGLQQGLMLHVTSYCLVLLGVALWVASTIRQERCHHPTLTVLLAAYLLLQFVAV